MASDLLVITGAEDEPSEHPPKRQRVPVANSEEGEIEEGQVSDMDISDDETKPDKEPVASSDEFSGLTLASIASEDRRDVEFAVQFPGLNGRPLSGLPALATRELLYGAPAAFIPPSPQQYLSDAALQSFVNGLVQPFIQGQQPSNSYQHFHHPHPSALPAPPPYPYSHPYHTYSQPFHSYAQMPGHVPAYGLPPRPNPYSDPQSQSQSQSQSQPQLPNYQPYF